MTILKLRDTALHGRAKLAARPYLYSYESTESVRNAHVIFLLNFTINYTIDVTDNGAGRLSHTEYYSCLSIIAPISCTIHRDLFLISYIFSIL